jgi:diaminopimelate decarboxylase
VTDFYRYRAGTLFCEGTPLDRVAAEFGTPTYVYSAGTIQHHIQALRSAFAEIDPQVRYAVKACGNVHVIREIARRGVGVDVVSGGELFRAMRGGVAPEDVVFAGVGKTEKELRFAVDIGVGTINVESSAELFALDRIAGLGGRTARAAVRVNPDVAGYRTPVETTTGVRGSKFGIDIERVGSVFDAAASYANVQLSGLHIHLGSPIWSPEPYVVALQKILELAEELRGAGHEISTINFGGGFAANYEADDGPSFADYAAAICPVLRPFVERGGRVLMEPGRSIVASAGTLLTTVQYVKDAGPRRVAVVDTGMSHLLRTVLYDAFHFIWPVAVDREHVPVERRSEVDLRDLHAYDVAGPVCESTDYLARERRLPELSAGDLLCVFTAGAYGMVMASQYNALPRPAEVLVSGGTYRLIRRRETYEDLVALELEADSDGETFDRARRGGMGTAEPPWA